MWRRAWADGRPLLAIGALGAGASGYFIWQEEQQTTIAADLRTDMHAAQTRSERDKVAEDTNAITKVRPIYDARVKMALGMTFDGPIALRELAKGEKVSILAENVGPDNRYHRCRSYDENEKPKMEGIYPSKFLEKITSL